VSQLTDEMRRQWQLANGCKIEMESSVFLDIIKHIEADERKITDMRHALELSRIALLNQKTAV
jgi:hypothetical protein